MSRVTVGRRLTVLLGLLVAMALWGCRGATEPAGPTLEKLDARMGEVGAKLGAPVYMRIFKEEAELEVWAEAGERYVRVGTWPICRYSGELGPKLAEGDGQAPEGFYEVPASMMNPHSKYHLAFNLGYPNAYDRAQGRTGSYLMVHGSCVSVGCYAMTDEGIDAIYALGDAAHRGGQEAFAVHIFPFRMTEANLARHADSEWIAFWRDLEKGYRIFEKEKRPPRIEVRGGRYVVGSGP